MARIWEGIAARHSRVKKISRRPSLSFSRNENDNPRAKLSHGFYDFLSLANQLPLCFRVSSKETCLFNVLHVVQRAI